MGIDQRSRMSILATRQPFLPFMDWYSARSGLAKTTSMPSPSAQHCCTCYRIVHAVLIGLSSPCGAALLPPAVTYRQAAEARIRFSGNSSSTLIGR